MRVPTMSLEDTRARVVSDADLERFRSFTQIGLDPRADCWMWTGSMMWKGYGRFHIWGKAVRAHKFAYMLSNGPVPSGLVIDHVCHNEDAACAGGISCLHRRCVNPFHLDAKTQRGNVLSSPLAPARINSEKTHCPQGHAYEGENLFVRTNGQRECRACSRDEARRYAAKKRSEAAR